MPRPSSWKKKRNDLESKARILGCAGLNKKALSVALLDMRERPTIAEFFIIIRAKTDIHARAIFQEIERVSREQGFAFTHIEGRDYWTWVLMDGGDVVVHILRQKEADYYQLEKIWRDCPSLPLEEA
jgi:ribosome-associated protein